MNVEETMPIREHPVRVQCRCVIFYCGTQDRCPGQVSDPDSPLCEACRRFHVDAADELPDGAVVQMAPR